MYCAPAFSHRADAAGNVPIRLVASLHNTSVKMIEKHYSKYITEHSTTTSRATGCCTMSRPPADNVVALAR